LNCVEDITGGLADTRNVKPDGQRLVLAAQLGRCSVDRTAMSWPRPLFWRASVRSATRSPNCDECSVTLAV
jgi:hypothetical protein